MRLSDRATVVPFVMILAPFDQQVSTTWREKREGKTGAALAVQFSQPKKLLSPFGSKFDQGNGWAASGILLEGKL